MILALTILIIQSNGSLSGFVVDASNGEKLSYANVYLENTSLGCATNEKGYYIIQNIPAGSYTIIFSYIGYETTEMNIDVKEGSTVMNIEMKPAVIEMDEVCVSAERTRFEKEVEVSHITFTPREIKSVPGLFEKDLIKTLQLMPGVVAMHDLSNKLYVRGGSPDENLVLLDGITVFNPSTHLFGLFSTFNPDVVSEAELYAGGFPAKFGDRLSSTLTITTKEGNSKRYAGEASLGLITSKVLLEGPIPKGSFLISARRTYFDALVWAYSKVKDDSISLPYYFYDGVAKVNFNPSPENRFTFAGLGGSDVMSFEVEWDGEAEEKIDLDWGNRGASLRWRRVFNPKLYGELIGAWSNFFTNFKYEDYIDSLQNAEFSEEIVDYTLKCDFNYFLNDKHTLDFGLNGKHLEIEYTLDMTDQELIDTTHERNLFISYLQDKWSLIPEVLLVQTGLRTIYCNSGNRYCFDPRFSLKYRIKPNTALNFAFGKYSQFLLTINSQESYFSIWDFWRPIGEEHDIPTSYHAIAGIEHWFDNNTTVTIEPYYKKYYNLLIPREDDIFFSSPSESLQVCDGYSAGIDFFLKKSYKNVFGWISYSFGFTRRKLEDHYYAPRYDRRHNLNIVFGITLPEFVPLINGSILNLRWNFASGLPYAMDLARYRYYHEDYYGDGVNTSDDWRMVKGPRDAHRLPVSHRLDLHLEKDIKLFGLKGSWYIDVINVYNRKNILCYSWDYKYEPPRRDEIILLPIPIPSAGISLRF